jgi:hypothetical protein
MSYIDDMNATTFPAVGQLVVCYDQSGATFGPCTVTQVVGDGRAVIATGASLSWVVNVDALRPF